jgi:hypothetical protein
MLKYIEFLLENVGDDIPFYFSFELRKILKNIISSKKEGYEVAEFLLSKHLSEDYDDDINYVDVTKTNDKLSFISMNRVKRFWDKGEEDPGMSFKSWSQRMWYDQESGIGIKKKVWSEQRTDIFVGRFVNRVYLKSKSSISSSDLEKFVNLYKSTYDKFNSKFSMFEVVKGEDIKKWYLKTNYEIQSGQLGSSCMRHDRCQEYFGIYVENPEVCQLLILNDKDPDKISGRALIWTLTSGEKYMDRPYTNHDADINLFNDYARKHKIRTDSDDLEVKVKAKDYGQYPYMDSLHYFNPKTGILTTDDSVYPHPDWIMLKKTDGSYQSGECVFSKYLDRYILEEEAVWAEDLEDWITKDDAVYVDSEDAWYSEEYMDNSNDNVVYCSWADVNEFEHKCVYSTFLNSWLIKDDSKEVWVNRSQEEWVPKTARYLSAVVEIDGEMKDCLVSAIVQDKNGKWQFKN